MAIISQKEAAEILNVTKQAVSKMKKTGTYSFFEGKKINTDHPQWIQYLENKKTIAKAEHNVKQYIKDKIKNDTKPVEKNKDKESIKEENELPEQENNGNKHGLTGGYDPAKYPPTNPQQLKSITEVIGKSIEMRIKLGEYVRRDIIESYMNEISRNIQIVFVDLARSVSVDIAEKLDRLGMEREIEKIIAPRVSKGISDLKRACSKVNDI